MPRRQHTSLQALQLFRLLLDAPEAWYYGYQLCEATGLKSGTLYPLLMRLADQGLLDAKWEESVIAGRPPRHLYRLTEAGVRLAQSRVAEFAPRIATRLAPA
jgi:PadR family transcriptional regulator, regulatory protein PadR